MLQVVELIFDLIFTKHSICALDLFVNPIVYIIVADKLEFILRYGHEEVLKTHGKEVCVLRNSLIPHFIEALNKLVLDRLHQVILVL